MTRCLGVYIALLMQMTVPALAAEQGAPVAVAATRQQAIFQTVQLTGTVTSPHTATLSVATSGLVEAVHVDEGARVQTGKLLLELDPDLAKRQLDSVAAKVNQAQIALRDSERRQEEAQTLVPQKSIAKSVVRDLEAEVAQNQALLQQALADQHYQQGVLDRHSLRAPFAGVISQKLTEQGEWLSPGDGVFELVGTENLRVDFYVAEGYLAKFDRDTEVAFTLNMDPGKVYHARIDAIVPVLDPTARTFLVRTVLKDGDKQIIPGMSVKALVKVAEGRDGIVVPKDALVRHRDGRVVIWIVEQVQDKWLARERVVKTGVAFDQYIEVTDGLALGQQVVVRGNESLQNGREVILSNADSNSEKRR